MIDDLMRESKTYREILEHRRSCPKWGKEFCMECFGGGLTKFSENLIKELNLNRIINKLEKERDLLRKGLGKKIKQTDRFLIWKREFIEGLKDKLCDKGRLPHFDREFMEKEIDKLAEAKK